VNLLRNWIENWLFGNRLREAEADAFYAIDQGQVLTDDIREKFERMEGRIEELRERCADIETDYATDQALSDLSEKVDALGVDDLESELEDIKRRILEQKKQIQIMDKILAEHLDRHNQPT
jgi:phage shock protein A